MKNYKGITLIALVVTIVVLLILAGVSISMLSGENGIISQTQNAKESTRGAEVKEKVDMAANENRVANFTNGIKKSKQDVINELSADGKLTSEEIAEIEANNKVIIGDIEIDFSVLEGSSVTLPSAEGTTPYLPSSYYSQVSGTDLNTGLVIRDSLGNEYVWIEVPRTATVYPTAGIEIIEFTDTEYTSIETDLNTYTEVYGNKTYSEDSYYSDETTGLTEEQYNNLKKTMFKSVYQNGGFWVGRYEAGIEINRIENTEIATDLKPLSQANQYPLTYITCSQAQELASRVATSGYTSSLMFGVQWNLILKYLEVKAVEKGTELATIQAELNTNSKEWGNYSDHLFSITNTSAKYSSDSGVNWNNAPYNRTTSTQTLLTTGASEKFCKQNLFDLAGNVCEFTLEDSNIEYGHCSLRGGYYSVGGSQMFPAVVCSYSDEISFYNTMGFRVSLY